MIRRSLLAALALTGFARPVHAAGGEEEAPASVNISGVGLPVIAAGRVQNYVFVSLRLHLSRSADPQVVRAKEAWFRDALVRAAHATPFTVANDWTRLDAAAMQRSLIQAAGRIVGQGKVARVEIVAQSPRRRTGVRAS